MHKQFLPIYFDNITEPPEKASRIEDAGSQTYAPEGDVLSDDIAVLAKVDRSRRSVSQRV